MHSERIFKVQIPDELKDNYKSGLPAFREPKLEAGENQHNHRVQGETVAGTLHESGLFVYTLSSGYIPVFLENVQVLVELEKFLVDSPTRSESRGLHYKKEPDGDKVPNKVVKWGSFVYGMVVAENTNWVQVGEYYLPIEWNGHQVLYPAESWNAAPKSFAPDQTARLCLFAPHEGDYFVTGTFTKSWKTAWDLTPEPFSESRAKGFRGRIYYVDVPVQELNNAEFKFRFHEKGTWKQVTDFLYITEKLKWEYDSLNNRTVKLDGRVAPGSKLFMYWGFPEASEQHVMEFLKVVLSGPGLNGLDEAMRRVDEVRQSVRQVTCKWPTARRTSVEQFDRLIPLALRDVLDSRPPAGPQPCSGVFVWMAVLEQRTRGNLSMLHHIRPEVVSVVAKWPPDIMSDARLAGCVHAAAKSALREEARNTSRKLSGQWLQAAIQVILHSETSIAEIPGAELVERGVVPQWAEIRLKDAPQARIESALRIAFKPAHTLQEVFDAAKAFLDHADRRAWGPLCVQTALEEGLAWVERSMDWGAGANNLQRLLDCLDDARVDEKNLVDIIQKAWRRLGARPHIIPEPTGHLNQSTRIVSQALTAEPEDADFVEFEGSSAFSWLRLAVLASNYSVTNDRWVASIAHFAARLCGQTKVAASFIKQAIKVLYSLRGSAVLQRATFERLWSFQRQLDATSILQTFGDEFQEEACLAFSVLQLHHSLHQMEEIRDMRTRAEQWHHLLVQADEHKHGNFVEVVLCFVVSRVCLVSDESSIAPAPELARLQDAWGGPGLKEERLGPVRMSWILLSPELWRQVIAIAKRPNQSNIGQIQSALRESLQSLRASILSEELTVQDMLTPKLAAWEGRNFIDLLEQEKIPEGQVRPKLEQMINKLHFMQKFERAVLSDLPQLLPRARQFAKQLHLLFLKASTGQPSITSTNVFGLEVSLARINDSAWVEEFEDEWLQLTVADVPQASFSSVLAAIETLHFARSQQNPPMQLMLQEVEQDLKSTGEELNVLDNIFFLHRGVTRLLKDLSGLRGEEAGLPSEILSSIERHWAGVAPQDVDRFLQGIQSVTSVFQGQGGLNEVSRRLQAVLAARQTVEFANHCTLILRHLSSKVKVPNKGLTEGFSLDTRSHMASLREMQEAFNAAKNKKSESNLTTKALDKVDHATQCLRQMFDFLGARGSGFELVLRLVTALAQVPGLSFLTVLLSSAQKGEHLAMRLAELVEGALTQETLAHVEQASAVFMPLCVASLAAMNMPVDANKFGAMVQGVWSKRIQREALGAWCEAAIGDLMLNMLQEAHANHRSNLRDFSDSLRSALRQGQVLQQKLEENSDDATAVSNTVHGMVSAGHLELTPSADGTHFEVVGVFEFSKDPVSRDVQQLTECSDKASLAVPKGTADADNPTALTQEKVQIFTGCVEGILGLRQELTELLQIGHPYLEDAGQLRFPRQGEGLSASTLQDLKDTLRWAQGAMQQWCNALDQARARHAIMSAIPARNITKLARAVLQNETRAVAPLMSLHFQTGTSFHKDQELEYALEKCKFLEPRERAHERFMDKLVEVLTAQVIPENTMTRFLPLHEVARNYPKKRACDDTTTRSRMERRQNPKFYPKRVLLIQEELSHESGNLALQSTATTTVLSLLLPLGIGPSAENLLLCDSSTTKDDILRFLHRVTHATRLAMDTSRQSQVLGVCVHVDCLQPDVLQELLCRVDAMQAAVGRRKEADSTAEIEVRLAFTLTARASKMLIETLEKDLCKQQQINVLKLSSIKAFLKEAGEERKAEGRTALGWHQVVTSEYAGDGKTHAIRRSEKWDPDSHVSVIWGGAQTRGQAARALRKAEGAGSVHLELHGFEEGGGVDADMLLMELLLFRCVFDPERSEWTRLAVETPLFVEVANSIKIKQGQCPAQLMLLSAPILEGVPGQNEIHADSPFLFDGNDLHPEVASSIAQDFALAGAALFLNDDRPHLVGCEDDAVFKLVASSQGQELVLAGDHANLLQRYSVDVDEAAKLALQEAWLHGVGAKADRDPPVPSKATIMSFLRFLAHWTRNWALHLHHYEQAFHGERGVNIPGTFLQVLKEMIPMAAAMCLRSSAAEAQMEQRERTVAENGEAASLSEAMACRVLDPRTSASRVWAFNTGGSLRFIGNRTELPSALQHLWDIVRRYTHEPIVPPPINLGNAEQLELRELLLDVMRGHNLTDKELEDAFRGFVLTQDNMIKLVDVAERLRAHLPCILMGEAGCGKTVLLRLTTRLLGAGELDEQQVHAGTTEADILEALSRAEELARKKEESKKDGGTEHMVVQFWDELNTCPHQPLFKQILVDRVNPSTNQPIHKGLRFVAACNPWRRASQGSVVCAGFESPVAQDDRLAGLAYRVHPLPESLFTHLSSFGQLDLDTEQQYVKEMASQHPQLLNPDDQWLIPDPLTKSMCDHAARYVCIIHKFFRDFGSCVSLRDPNRLLKLWGFIRWELKQREKLNMPKGSLTRHLSSDASKGEVKSLVLAIHLAYEIRLPDLEKRNELLATLFDGSNLGSLFQKYFPETCSDELERIETWRGIVEQEQDYWLEAIDVADNIAKIRALRENIYATLICSMTRTPIFILGKPGCSKSLTVSLLISALADPYKDQLLHLASFSVQPYQGSRQSTSSSLLAVFERALARQKKLRTLNRRTRPLALVLLDEVGLAEQSPHNPLKVLHARLEPRRAQDAVSVIAISNWELDRSKLSRGLLLACPPPSESDLSQTALAIIRAYLAHESQIRGQLEASLGHMATAFMEILKNQEPQDFHGLRDWYGMCSFAARLLLAADVEMGFGSEEVKHGALMHAVSHALRKEAVQLVKLCRERELQFVPADWALKMAVLNNVSGNHSSGALHKMLHSLSQEEKQDSYQSISALEQIYPEVLQVSNRLDSLLGDVDGRHIMVITDSPGPVIAWIQHRARQIANWNPESLVGSPLEQDQASTDMYAQSMIQAAIVSMAQERRLLVLQNLDIIYAALYDVFNSNYSRASGPNSQRYCRIAREGFCNPRCAVADQFKAVLVVTRERAARYEPALLNRFAKLEVELADLLGSMDEVLEWREEVALMCPAAEGKNGELPTDLVAACPIDEDEPDLSTLLQSLTLSAFMRHAQRTSLHTGEISAKEALFSPLISPEFLEGQPNSPSWCRSSKSHFGELLQQICDSLGDSAGHTIIPLLIPTFSAPNQTLDLDAVKELPNYGKVFSEINMEGMPSQATLRESMKEHVERIAKQLSEGRGRVLSALHVHVNMKQDHAQDIVDYLRFQLEWCAGELFGLLHEKPGLLTQSALHVLAVVAHGVRGDDGSRSIRPFLLAGPVTERTDASPDVKMFQWTGIAVDHFSHLLPWGMRPEELLNGTIKEIFGLQDESPDRFRRILADALPHVVPRFGSEPHHADSFVIIQSLMREINSKPELVSGIRSVLAEQLSLEEADWRMDVAKNIELLRRTGPFQLALLSHLRRDDKIQPVIKAVWQHSLHTSCPNKIAPEEDAIQSVHWRPVAESLLHHVLSSAIHQAEWEPMLSQRHPGEMRTLLMPGSAAAMQILLPQLQSKEGLRDRNFIEVLMDQAVQLAAVLPRCLPATLCNALNAVGQSLSSGKAGDVIGLFGDDVITEMTARACASVQEWPGSATFESVRLHLHVIVRALMRNMARQQADDAGNPIDQQESKRDEYPHMLKALLPAVAAVLLLPLSQQVAALQTQFPTLHTWADCLEALLNPFPLAGTWRTFFERGMQAAFQLHGLDLEDSLCSSADAGEDLQDSLQLLQQLSVAIEDFVITVGCTDASIVRVAAISHMLSSSKGIAPDKAMSILSFMRNKSNVHLLEAVAGLIEVQDIDTAIPLVGVSYALQLLGEESKKDPAALKACLTLMNQAIQRSDNDFQKLHPLKTYLQQISIYLMEHLMSRVGVSTINSWPEAEEIGERVLSESFYALMEEQEAGLTTSATVMHLLEDVLPSTAQGCGWDTPLVACLAAALSTTSQLSLVIANLVKHSLKKKLGNPSKRALQMLEDAFKKTLSILQRRDPQKSQVFVAFVLARELVLHSVDVVETYLETDNEELQQRLEKVLTCIVEALEMQFAGSTRVDADTAMLLCTYEGRDLRVEQLPTAFASLYVVAATRRREAPLPTNTAIKHLLEVVAFIAGGGDSGLHCFLESCRDEMVTLSNALGLSLLLPDQSKVADIKTVVSCLHDLGSEEQSCSQQAAKQFEGLCHEKRDNFQALLQSMRAVGEVACMQCSAEDEETLDLAGRIARELPSVLGPAGVLLRLKADDETPWNIDFLNMDAEKAWQASIFAHLICFLGAAHVSINRRQEDLPPAIKPFVAFNSIDEPTLNSTFWPGVPNDWWQSLRYSGLHKHLLPVTGNIVWGQCQCGYRYCYAECGAPVSAAKCPSPEGEGRCTLMNGGQNHTFAPHQQLIAVVVTAHPHGTGWPPVYSSMSQGFPAAFRPPPPSPGLFALTEADLHISVTEKERAVVSHSLMSETVRQDWNQPLGKPPDPKSGLHPIAFRVLHLLIHASALIGIEMEWVQERDNIVQLLQGHLRQVARMNPVRNANDTVWYFMANVEADLDALAKLLNGTLEVATLFMHAVLHRLGSLQPHEQPSGQTLTSHNARVAYETWFHNTIIQPILGEKGASGDFPLPGVHALRREAGQATDPNLLLKADFLARRGLQTGAWANMKEDVRAALLPHVLRPLVSASIGDTFEELVAASMGGNRFVILRLLMAGVEEESASWRILPDLARAASLAWILPFMQLVRDKEGGKITMREARTTTIRKWLESRAGHEQHHAWITFRNFEAAWNAALASDQLRDGCGVIRLPRITLESPLAMACPIANPEKPQHGDIEVGNLDKPEHIASLGLHHLAVSHNKLIAQVNAYLVASNAIAAHVRARLHPSAGLCQSSGQCQPAAETCHDQSVRLIQKASATDLFVFPSQLEDACAVEDDVHPHGPRTFRLDYKIGTFCQDFFQVPWSADPPARGEHDFEAMESDLAWRLIVGRRPLQICSDLGEEQDHSNLDKDIDAFPYRIFHGSVDVRILNRLKGSRLVQQVSLSEALSVQKAEDLEISFFRDTSHALEVSKITGDLIALLLGVNVAHAFRSDMTLLEFVEVFTLVDKAPHQDRKCENHPDALMRIADLPDVATVPLNALVALHLLSKDMLAMTRGVSIKTRDTGTEYTKSLDLPPQFKDGLDKLKEECPQVLAVVCRLVARTVYLASELPLDHDHRHDKEKFQKAPPLCMLVKQMDILDELAEVGEGKEEQAEELLEMPVPLDLEYWNDWNEGHAIAAVKIYRSLWSEIREPYLAPAKPVLAASNDPAVASGMAKGLATSGWLQPKVGRGRGPRRVKGFKKKDQDESEEDGDWEVIDPIDPTSPVKTRPVKAGRGNKSSAERQRQDQAGATFVGKVHYSGSWADELAAIMADKTAESYSVRTKGGQGSSIPFVAGGQPGELVSTPMSEDFPLIVIPKKAEANPHNPQRPQGLEGLDFMRDVLEKFINQRAGGPDHGRTIEKEDAKQVALAWDDVEMMGEALQPLLMPLGQDVDVTEERGRFVTEFHQHFEQQQNSMPRPIKDHVQPSQLQTCILEAKGWTLRKSPGDGHCQFHSVGFAVGEGHETVRSHALAWITQHREEYKMKMVVERNGTPASFTDTVEDDELESALDKYIARMSEGAWGDNITLHALAHHYQREIRVLTDNVKNAWVQIEPGFGNPIYVAFYAEFHYDSVITETPTL